MQCYKISSLHMRVLVILKYIPSLHGDRKSDSLWSVVDGMKDQGFEVVLATQGKVENDVPYPVISKIPSSFISHLYKILSSIALRLRAKSISTFFNQSIIARNARDWRNYFGDIDVVVALCTANHPALIAQKAAKALRVPYIIREHKTYDNGISVISDLPSNYLSALRGAKCVLAVSNMLAERMRSIGVRSDLGVIPNSISDSFFEHPVCYAQRLVQARKVWGEDTFIYGGWTRWREFKRLDLLLMAFYDVLQKQPSSRLIVAGPIEPESNYDAVHQFINKYDLGEFVIFYGIANRDEIHQISNFVDCAVISSDYETFGLPALEAMASGKPVVTTRCNGPEMLISSDELGYVVERGDEKELSEAMQLVYVNRDSFDHNIIKKTAWELYSTTSVSKIWGSLILQVVNDESHCR